MTATVQMSAVSEPTTLAGGPQIVVLQRDDDDWAALWSAWLRALADSPDAFVARHADEVKVSEPAWRERLRGSTWAAAWDAGLIVGIAQLVEGSGRDEAGMYYVQSVWVDEAYRRQGVLRRLLEHLEISARSSGVERIYLWVLATNPDAEKAYDKLQFVEGGKVQKSDKRIGAKRVREILMVRQVSGIA